MRVIKAGEKINNICSIKDNKWIELKAETYEKLAKKEENNSSKILHLLQAIKLNKELKNEKKKKELIREYEKTKEKIEMPTISYKVPYFYEMLLELEEAAKRMGEEDSETILAHLMFNNDLLVGNYENLTKLTADANEKSPLFFGMTKILYDERGHVKEQYRTEEEREHFALNQNYEHYIMLSSRYLDNLIHYAIINKKISYDSIMSFIKDKTWLGKKSEKNTLMFNHIFYISCIIKQYFQEYYIYLNYPQYNPQFVLTMDSLSLKIEGIIRDFCKILNISTTRINADNTSEEKTLNQLLKEEKLKEMIGENDLFFLKFVLIDQGFNLRNKIAHSLMQPSEYNETYVNLLILALFRLLKYKLK